jgi:hypothetical protein
VLISAEFSDDPAPTAKVMFSKPSQQVIDPSSLGKDPFPSCAPARKVRGLIFLQLFMVAIICSSCGSMVSNPPLLASVSVTPGSAQPFAGAPVQFSVMVENAWSSAVTWQVNSVPGGNATVGTISAAGLYTAPNAVPSPPMVIVTAVLQTDATKSGSSNVTIQPDSAIQSISISPALSSATTLQALQLQVVASGVTNPSVLWKVDGVSNGNSTSGTISASGLYTSPGSPGNHLVTAQLTANPGAVGSAQIEITDFSGTLTWRNDNSRSGVNSQELVLTPRNVTSSTFGKLFSCLLDGYAYAQPLYMANLATPGNGTRNVIFVATENDSVFAFDADASPCVLLWKASLIPAGSQAVLAGNLGSNDVSPFIGITGTPVVGASASALYVVAKTMTSVVAPAYSQTLYALDLATGQPKIIPTGAPITIQGTPLPLLENQRAALLLDNGIVYIAFGSYQGLGVYHGWLLAYNASTLQQTAAFNVTSFSPFIGGGIWQSGGGPSADLYHNIFVLTGDGPFDLPRGGLDYSNSFLRLSPAGALAVADYFTPCGEATLGFADFGASAPLLLPDSAGSASAPHLAVSASKGGSLYVVNRDQLGGYDGTCQTESLPRVQTVAVGDGPILSTPIFWDGSIYVAAGNGRLKSFPMPGGVVAASPSSSQSAETFGPLGATPAISSNGASNPILWLIDSSGALPFPTPSTPAILRAFDPGNSLNEIYNSGMAAGSRDTAGAAVKFTVPTVANGKVYVGTQTALDVYGLLP